MAGPWVITGAGIVSAAGDTPADVAAAVAHGRPLATQREQDDVPTVAIDNFDPKSRIARKGVKDLSRASQLACAAAAGLVSGLDGVAATDVGVVFGTAWGSLETVIEFDQQAHVQGPRFVDPFLFAETVSNIPAGQIAIFFGWSAFNATVSSGAASGLAALHRALAFLDENRGRVAVAGGGDALSVRLLRALRAQGSWAARAGSLPLTAERSGRIGGEGACLLTVESAAHATQRNVKAMARIDATVSGHLAGSAPSRRPAATELIRMLLDRAGLAPGAIDAVVLSASGDVAGDAFEAGAVIDAFGAGASAPPVLAPKAILGETWGASGALAVALAAEIIRSGSIPGAPAGFVLDPALEGLNVPSSALRRHVQHVVVLDSAEHGQQLGAVLSAP